MKKSELMMVLNNLKRGLQQNKKILKAYKVFSKTLESFGNFISLKEQQTINELQSKIERYKYLIKKIKKEIEVQNGNDRRQ